MTLPVITEIHSARKLLLAGNAGAALDLLEQFVDAEFATLSLVRGECLYVLGRFRDAVREFKQAILLAPNSPRTEILLELAGEMAQLEATLRPLPTIEQLLPSSGEEPASFTMPIVEFEDSTNEAAEEIELTETEDEVGLVSETLASIMMKQGKYDDARKVYIQLSRLNPDRYEYYRSRMDAIDELQERAKNR